MKSLVEPIKRLCKLPAGYLYLRNPEIRDWRKWRPKEEMGGNGRARERERERVLTSVAVVCKMI